MFELALRGDLPDPAAENVRLAVALTDPLRLPKALATRAAHIERNCGSVILASGLDAAHWRALLSDPSVRAIEAERPRRIAGVLQSRSEAHGATRYLHGMDQFLGNYPGMDGRGIGVGVIDVGAAAANLDAFQTAPGSHRSRVEADPPNLPVDEHSTNMAGVIAALDLPPEARGMVPQSNILSSSYKDPFRALAAAAARGIRLSNHSYVPLAGWESFDGAWHWFGDQAAGEDASFGKYGLDQVCFDSFLSQHPEHAAFAAVGNDGGNGPSTPACPDHPDRVCAPHLEQDAASRWVEVRTYRQFDGGARGYDDLTGLCLAKNSICVAYGARDANGDWEIASDASTGPADDGRIKPDLTAQGLWVAAVSTIFKPHANLTGSSASAAVATGIAAALTQHFQARRGRLPSAAELKGVLLHTATDPGAPERTTPNPRFGWGVLNAAEAGRVIADSGNLIRNGVLTDQQTIDIPLQPTEAKIRITLTWTDPPGEASSPGVNDRTPSLRNDLDVSLIRAGPHGAATTFFPYSLDAAHPERAATTLGPNRVDTVERIDVPADAASRWTLRIRGARVFGTQAFSLIVSGARVRQ